MASKSTGDNQYNFYISENFKSDRKECKNSHMKLISENFFYFQSYKRKYDINGFNIAQLVVKA